MGGIGASLRRREDARFLRGQGRFVADLNAPNQFYARFVRSPHAHARILRIDTGGALALTGADLAADNVGPMRTLWPVPGLTEPPRFALPRERVRHVGEALAVVLAESAAEALDAAERVLVEYEPLPPVRDEVAVRWERGDAAAVERAFGRAAHVVRASLRNQRLAGCAIEPRAVLALPEPFTLYSATQVPHHVRRLVTEQLGLPEASLRVVAPDVGGGFGYKGKHYPEETVCAWAARRFGRPVKWVADRSESFLADTGGRDHVTEAELALDRDGRFLGLRVRTTANLGAYVSTFGAAIPTAIYSALLAGPYLTPAIHVAVTGMFSSTAPTDAYRGAGRPEACLVLERLADAAARTLGLDRAEIRRRNLIPASAMPYKTLIGPTYDSGDFPRLLGRALAAADWEGFERRRRGRRRGIGIACYVESSGVAPSKLAGALGARAGFHESAEIRLLPDGGVQTLLGTHSQGQGHATVLAQILGDKLGIAPERIEIVEGDTGAVPYGAGTFGSRSIAVGGSALVRAADKVLAKARRLAAHKLEAAEADLEFRASAFAVAGTDRCVTLADIARAALYAHDLPPGEEPGLHETAFYDPPNFAFSNGVHVCEIEVDEATGAPRLVGWWAVDDIGTVINPLLAEGQVQGGLAQGIGQALLEHALYDAQGQLLTGSLMDYALPRADELPTFATEFDRSQPCRHNPLGAKGVGEAGAIAAPAAVVSALCDALGVDALDMPATPERIWRAMR